MDLEHSELIKASITDADEFVRAIFSGRRRGFPAPPWVKVILRPVIVSNKRQVQFSYLDAAKDITKNYSGKAIDEQLDDLIAVPFKNIFIQMRDKDIHIIISNKGKVSISTKKRATVTINLEHDRQKRRLLTLENSAIFLEKVGLATREGKIKADMQRKYVQINEYVKLIQETGYFSEQGQKNQINVVDLGCGNAYLTFATYHFVANILGIPVQLTGVDVKSDLIDRNNAKAHELGWENLVFQTSKIADFDPAVKPDIVIALHACDTATDDAIARGILWRSQLIVTAPCCHHHIQAQLTRQSPPHPFHPMLRHAILKERFGDMLTDTFRALILRMMGYSTDIIEFIATEHTPKNLMIRSVQTSALPNSKPIHEYNDLKALWGVTPYLETLLGDNFISLISPNNREILSQ